MNAVHTISNRHSDAATEVYLHHRGGRALLHIHAVKKIQRLSSLQSAAKSGQKSYLIVYVLQGTYIGGRRNDRLDMHLPRETLGRRGDIDSYRGPHGTRHETVATYDS